MNLSAKAKYHTLKYTSGVVLLLLAVLFISTTLLTHRTSGSAHSLKPTCQNSLQDQIDNASSGGIIKVRTDCIYRESVNVNKPLTLDGQGGAEIRGSDVWTSWTRNGSVWVSTQSVPSFSTHGSCSSDSNGRCRWAEQVFVNGNALFQQATGSTPASGEFALNGSRQIVIADNPSGQTVEVTTRRRWVLIEADNVTVTSFTMKHAAVDSQEGAIEARNTADNAVIKNNALSDAHGAVAGFSNVSGGRLLGNDIYNGGQLGISVDDTHNVAIEGNLIHHNNTEAFSTGWEAGALKISRSTDSIFRNNTSNYNIGPGYWCDIDCDGAIVSHNNIHHNTGMGIFYEISTGGKIFENNVWENRWGDGSRTWAYEAGILVSSSRNTEVHNNRVAWHGDGIAVISQCRAHHADNTCDTSHRWNTIDNNFVHDNVVIMEDDPRAPYNVYPTAWARDIDDELGQSYNYMYSPEANNRGANNGYWIPLPEQSTKIRFFWNNSNYSSLASYSATPAEENGYYLSNTQKNSLLSSHGIPTSPEDHTNPRPNPVPVLGGSYVSAMPRSEPDPSPSSPGSPSQPGSTPAQDGSTSTSNPATQTQSAEDGSSPETTSESSQTASQAAHSPGDPANTPGVPNLLPTTGGSIGPYLLVGSVVTALGVGYFFYQKRH